MRFLIPLFEDPSAFASFTWRRVTVLPFSASVAAFTARIGFACTCDVDVDIPAIEKPIPLMNFDIIWFASLDALATASQGMRNKWLL